MKIYIDKINSDISLNEETHIYSVTTKDGLIINGNQLSTTTLIGMFQEFSFEDPKWGMYAAIAKKYFPDKGGMVAGSFKIAQDAMKTHLDMRKERGTALHLKAENKQLLKIENLISKIINSNKNIFRINELKFFVNSEEEYGFNLTGTIDVVLLNKEKKEVVLIDYKFSNQNKHRYLEKQLNIYMAVLKKIGLTCKTLIGLTIHDNETIETSIIEDKEFKLETLLEIGKYFRKGK